MPTNSRQRVSQPLSPTPLPVRKQRQLRRSQCGFQPRIVELDPVTESTLNQTPQDAARNSPALKHSRTQPLPITASTGRSSVSSRVSSASSALSQTRFNAGNLISSTMLASPQKRQPRDDEGFSKPEPVIVSKRPRLSQTTICGAIFEKSKRSGVPEEVFSTPTSTRSVNLTNSTDAGSGLAQQNSSKYKSENLAAVNKTFPTKASATRSTNRRSTRCSGGNVRGAGKNTPTAANKSRTSQSLRQSARDATSAASSATSRRQSGSTSKIQSIDPEPFPISGQKNGGVVGGVSPRGGPSRGGVTNGDVSRVSMRGSNSRGSGEVVVGPIRRKSTSGHSLGGTRHNEKSALVQNQSRRASGSVNENLTSAASVDRGDGSTGDNTNPNFITNREENQSRASKGDSCRLSESSSRATVRGRGRFTSASFRDSPSAAVTSAGKTSRVSVESGLDRNVTAAERQQRSRTGPGLARAAKTRSKTQFSSSANVTAHDDVVDGDDDDDADQEYTPSDEENKNIAAGEKRRVSTVTTGRSRGVAGRKPRSRKSSRIDVGSFSGKLRVAGRRRVVNCLRVSDMIEIAENLAAYSESNPLEALPEIDEVFNQMEAFDVVLNERYKGKMMGHYKEFVLSFSAVMRILHPIQEKIGEIKRKKMDEHNEEALVNGIVNWINKITEL